MYLEEYLISHGVIITKKFAETSYENLENVIGKEVYICDIRVGKEPLKKFIRNIPVKKAKIFPEEQAKKNIYYSPIFFKEIKNGKVLKTEIAPYDNTGYRLYPGVSLQIFDTEEEAIRCFEKQIEEAKALLKEEFARVENLYTEKIQELDNLFMTYCSHK